MLRNFYAEDMVANGGLSIDEARRKAIADTEQLFPDDHPSADQFLFVIEADGEHVGELWIAEREGSLWIYDVHVQDGHRGRGFGRDAMLLAEAEARNRGFSRIGLNVFGGNAVARTLYLSIARLHGERDPHAQRPLSRSTTRFRRTRPTRVGRYS
jgi:GNAT superfamily N-acetyltransferase